MTTLFNYFFILKIFTLNILFGLHVYAAPYDYSFTLECKAKPDPPLYEGGIIENPEFNEDLKGWAAYGNAKLAIAKSPDGNNYAVASNIITEFTDGISQTFNADREMLYTVSAWIQISAGEAKVEALVKTGTGNVSAGSILVKSGCWSMFKGGFTLNVTESAALLFEVGVKGIDLWVDSISMQPFTLEEWDSHTAQNVEKVRKTKVKFSAVDQNGKAVANAGVSIKQVHPNYPFGCAVNGLIINNTAYQKWFLERFTYASFENELKWQANEPTKGVETYAEADAMLEFAKSNGITVRGHNILWEDTKYQAPWVVEAMLKYPDQLRDAAMKRVNSVVSRYKGQFIHWDVINENLHYDNISRVFPEKGAEVFKLTHQLDPASLLFLNEFNVIEDCSVVGKASTPNFIAKINELRKLGYDGPLGIGLESHFDYIDPNIPYVRAALDTFAATGLPIWVTEFTVADNLPNQMKNFLPLLREFHSHAAVEGIIIWSTVYPHPDEHGKDCYTMCLTGRGEYKNKAPGDALDKFLHEFIRVADSNGKTDSNGIFEASLVHGEYEATLTGPNGPQPLTSQTFNLLPKGSLTTVELKVNI